MTKNVGIINDEMMEWACFDGDEVMYDPSDKQLDIYKDAICTSCGRTMLGLDCTRRCYEKERLMQLVKQHNAMQFSDYMG